MKVSSGNVENPEEINIDEDSVEDPDAEIKTSEAQDVAKPSDEKVSGESEETMPVAHIALNVVPELPDPATSSPEAKAGESEETKPASPIDGDEAKDNFETAHAELGVSDQASNINSGSDVKRFEPLDLEKEVERPTDEAAMESSEVPPEASPGNDQQDRTDNDYQNTAFAEDLPRDDGGDADPIEKGSMQMDEPASAQNEENEEKPLNGVIESQE
ncbi:hypothetical protein HDU96_010416 [Phlyctochytrium bullatum]|nr:hypothetical protein HDU96_010416 [Phlyctochytrium bullatum]